MTQKGDTEAKVVIVTSYPFPDSAATANRISTLANEMSKEQRLKVVVVGPGPKANLDSDTKPQQTTYDIISVSGDKFNRTNLVKRAIGEFKQTRNLLKTAKRQNADIYVASLPSIFLVLITTYVLKKPIIFDFRDLVWGYLIRSSGVKSLAGRAVKLLMPIFLFRARAISVTNSHEKEELSRLTRTPISVVGNGISCERFDRLTALQSSSNEAPYTVTYIGNIGMAQNLETLLEAIGSNPQFNICLVGDGNRADYLKSFVRQKQYGNVSFTGSLEWNDTLKYIANSNCLYGQIGDSFTSAVPSKLYEYLCCGKSVAFGLPDGVAKDLVADFKNISVCKPCDPIDLREKLLELKNSPAINQSSIEYNRDRIQKHHLRETQAKELVNLLNSIVDESVKN